MPQFDLIIIGAGAAGSSCAGAANEKGLRVALIERDALGGTCLNYGCDPTKTALYVAKLRQRARQARPFGLVAENTGVDWPLLQERIQEVQQQMRGGTVEEARQKMRADGIELIMGEAAFRSSNVVTVNDRDLQADHILIATGTRSAIPDIPGLAESNYLTNRTIFDLDAVPQRLVIIGAGPVGTEFAQLFARMGTAVTLCEVEDHILPQDNPDLAELLADVLQAEGVDVHTGISVTAVSSHDQQRQVTLMLANGREKKVLADELLLATGRQPVVGPLNLDEVGVAVTENGRVSVNDTLQTNIPHIWAAGDVVGPYPFTHVATRQGRHVAQCVARRAPEPFVPGPIPWVTYTDPELAHAGQTPAELHAAGTEFQTTSLSFADVPRAVTTGQTTGQLKICADEDGRILGVSILADKAGELLGPMLLAMRAGLSKDDLAQIIWPYPTMSGIYGNMA